MFKLRLRVNEKTDLDQAFKGVCKNCGQETWEQFLFEPILKKEVEEVRSDG